MTKVRPVRARSLRRRPSTPASWAGCLLAGAIVAGGCVDGTDFRPLTFLDGGAVVDIGVVDVGVDDGGLDAGVPMAVPADMVEVPAGPFLMGCNAVIDSQCADFEHSLRTVDVARFAIDITEVTSSAYEACVSAGACTKPDRASAGPEHPVEPFDWYGAVAYCRWRGKRLPTGAEWEKAARGTDGRIWPTGNSVPTCSEANLVGCVSETFPSTWPAGSVPGAVSPYGALDMAGNVWEWTSDRLEFESSPPFPFRVYRGGSWRDGARSARSSIFDWFPPFIANAGVGFRCAQSL